jgi:hypothetical protein
LSLFWKPNIVGRDRVTTAMNEILDRRALPGESSVQIGVGAPPMRNLMRNWASGIPRLNLVRSDDISINRYLCQHNSKEVNFNILRLGTKILGGENE